MPGVSEEQQGSQWAGMGRRTGRWQVKTSGVGEGHVMTRKGSVSTLIFAVSEKGVTAGF